MSKIMRHADVIQLVNVVNVVITFNGFTPEIVLLQQFAKVHCRRTWTNNSGKIGHLNIKRGIYSGRIHPWWCQHNRNQL